MARSILEIFRSLMERNAEDTEDEEGTFVPSPMDLSIRISHAGPDDEINRELEAIEERANELEEHQRTE